MQQVLSLLLYKVTLSGKKWILHSLLPGFQKEIATHRTCKENTQLLQTKSLKQLSLHFLLVLLDAKGPSMVAYLSSRAWDVITFHG